MSKQKQITVVEQREVAFYGDRIIAVQSAEGDVYASVRHMSDALGIDQRTQRRKILDNPVLESGQVRARIDYPTGGRVAIMLRVDLIPLWLVGIEIGKVSDEIAPKLRAYVESAARVLWDAFRDGRLNAVPADDELTLEQALARVDPETARAYEIAVAMIRLAEQQVMLEARMQRAIEQQAGRLDEHEARLATIETALSSPRVVSDDQAAQVSQAVKAVALALGKSTRRNEFGAVYGELYRRFGVSSYKLLPADKFDDAMTFLAEWLASIDDPAF